MKAYEFVEICFGICFILLGIASVIFAIKF